MQINYLLIFLSASLLFLFLSYLRLKSTNNHLLKKQKKDLSLRKSREVIMGQTAEKLAPFLSSFTYDPQKSQFLGQPIDYIVFEDEKIIFLEVKSGKATLSAKQKLIKNLVENKKVEWRELRI